jgi:hypothetical protein
VPPKKSAAGAGERNISSFHFEDPSDRTNMDALYGYFTYEIMRADWFDGAGNAGGSCSVEEAAAICATVVENMLKNASGKEAFLINLAALAGGNILLSPERLKCTREEVLQDRTRYKCSWELRLGDIRGEYSMHETVMHNRWKRPAENGDDGPAEAGSNAENGPSGMWAKKYAELLTAIRERDRETIEMKYNIMEAIRGANTRKP